MAIVWNQISAVIRQDEIDLQGCDRAILRATLVLNGSDLDSHDEAAVGLGRGLATASFLHGGDAAIAVLLIGC